MWCVTPLYICTQSILLWICTRYLNKLPCNYPLGIYLVDCNIIKSTQSWMWLVVIKNRIIMSINDFNYLCIMYIHSLLERTTCIYCNYRWNVTYTEYASNSFGNTAFQGIVDHSDHRNILYTCSKYFQIWCTSAPTQMVQSFQLTSFQVCEWPYFHWLCVIAWLWQCDFYHMQRSSHLAQVIWFPCGKCICCGRRLIKKAPYDKCSVRNIGDAFGITSPCHAHWR